MYKPKTLKILVIGPEASGKSTVVNFLAGKDRVLQREYRPTFSCRVVEILKETTRGGRQKQQITVELWDVSGNIRYQRCWPAIQKNANGAILVYNADNIKHSESIKFWIQKFPRACSIPNKACVIFAHHLNGKIDAKGQTSIEGINNLMIEDTSVEQGSTSIMPAFQKFLGQVMQSIQERMDKQQNNLVVT